MPTTPHTAFGMADGLPFMKDVKDGGTLGTVVNNNTLTREEMNTLFWYLKRITFSAPAITATYTPDDTPPNFLGSENVETAEIPAQTYDLYNIAAWHEDNLVSVVPLPDPFGNDETTVYWTDYYSFGSQGLQPHERVIYENSEQLDLDNTTTAPLYLTRGWGIPYMAFGYYDTSVTPNEWTDGRDSDSAGPGGMAVASAGASKMTFTFYKYSDGRFGISGSGGAADAIGVYYDPVTGGGEDPPNNSVFGIRRTDKRTQRIYFPKPDEVLPENTVEKTISVGGITLSYYLETKETEDQSGVQNGGDGRSINFTNDIAITSMELWPFP